MFRTTGRKLDINIPEEKAEIKRGIFQSLYGNAYLNDPEADIKRLFAQSFPTVYKIFSLIKKGDHAKLAIALQLVESELILRKATKLISNHNPHLPIFTIHDSIVTLTEHRDMVRMVLKDEFEQAIGLKPSLSFEEWNPKNV